ncbi:hypothetical protein FRC00_007549, partial [Tulasnella sp. 408]
QWNGAGPETGNKGYCFHHTHLFPTWHRPYSALYEQALYLHVGGAAAKFTVDRAEWLRLAEDFRLPFWDWGLNALPPKEFYDVDNAVEVTIIDYDGATTPVKNPLLSYSFKAGHAPPPPGEEGILAQLGELPSTIRHPTLPLDKSSKSQVDRLKLKLTTLFKTTPGNLSRLLLTVNRWYPFSTTMVEPTAGFDGRSSTNSLESIHDSFHVGLGGPSGHMNQPAYAAFDPIFWLHHANVDRVLAMWQVIHYNSWILPAADGDETWTTRQGEMVDENTQLSPFWLTPESCWSSAQVRDIAAFRYTYPDFKGIDVAKRSEAREAIIARVKQLYGSPSTSGSLSASQEGFEWTCRIRAITADLRHVCSILVFVGEVPKDEPEVLTSPNYIGSFDPFVNVLTTSCGNCAERAGTYIQGFVHMSSGLAARGIDIHNTEAVEAYLRENLAWIIQKSDGSIGAVDDVPSLEVTVVHTRLTALADEEDGLMASRPREHPGITEGRPGGYRRA